MNDLLSGIKVSGFEIILRACKSGGMKITSAVDGGAGWGGTSNSIAAEIDKKGKVFAFEPFPGNHDFFETCDSKIKLIKKALSDKNKKSTLSVPSTVDSDSNWAHGEMMGYSSVGFLSNGFFANIKRIFKSILKKGSYISVDAVRGDDEIDSVESIDFIKLDLQGGELNALRGMSRLLLDVKMLWVEFSGDMQVHKLLNDSNFLIFDSEYLFPGEYPKEAEQYFEFSRYSKLSTGEKVWWGYRKKSYTNFSKEFKLHQEKFGMIQTDFLCVNRKNISEFVSILPVLSNMSVGLALTDKET